MYFSLEIFIENLLNLFRKKTINYEPVSKIKVLLAFLPSFCHITLYYFDKIQDKNWQNLRFKNLI